MAIAGKNKTTRNLRRGPAKRVSLGRALKNIFRELRVLKILTYKKDPKVDIALLDNETLKDLKWKYLKKTAPVVDVLSFPNGDFPVSKNEKYLGEIYLNRDIVESDPSRGGFLLLHGVLHLFGYRHDESRDIIVMEELERKISRALGFKKLR
jgi:probable rRNA maturation factor